MITTNTSTGHTLTYQPRHPFWVTISGPRETIQNIPDAEIHAFAHRLGMGWVDQADVTTLWFAMPFGAIERLRAKAGAAGDMARVRICDDALAGHAEAVADCARFITAAHLLAARDAP